LTSLFACDHPVPELEQRTWPRPTWSENVSMWATLSALSSISLPSCRAVGSVLGPLWSEAVLLSVFFCEQLAGGSVVTRKRGADVSKKEIEKRHLSRRENLVAFERKLCLHLLTAIVPQTSSIFTPFFSASQPPQNLIWPNSLMGDPLDFICVAPSLEPPLHGQNHWLQSTLGPSGKNPPVALDGDRCFIKLYINFIFTHYSQSLCTKCLLIIGKRWSCCSSPKQQSHQGERALDRGIVLGLSLKHIVLVILGMCTCCTLVVIGKVNPDRLGEV